jgi:hypothetical protein
MGPIDDSCAAKVWRGKWTAEEDEIILHGVLKHGTAWDVVAQEVGTRSADSVRNRWQRIKSRPLKSGSGLLHGSKVDPTMANGITAHDLYGAGQPGWCRFTQHEDGIMMDAVERMGKQWRKIAELLPGRTENSVRNRHTRLEEEMGRQPSHSELASEPPQQPLVFVTPLLPVPHVPHAMPMAYALPLLGGHTASYASATMPPLVAMPPSVAVPPSAAVPPFSCRPTTHVHHTTLLAPAPAITSATVPAALQVATRKRGVEEVTGIDMTGIDLTSAPRIAVHGSIGPQPVSRGFVSGCSGSSTGEGVSYTDISTSESGRASILTDLISEPVDTSVELNALVESFFAN